MYSIKKVITLVSAVLFVLLFSAQAQAFQVPGPLVDTAWLEQNLGNVVILDVRNGASELDAFVTTGHIPGAVLVNWAQVRTTRTVRVTINGVEKEVVVTRYVPTKEQFSALMQKSGVNNDSAVVITFKGYISDDVTMGSRLYWTLKYFGHDNVALLNGGTSMWMKEGRPISKDPSSPVIGNFVATTERAEMLATTEDVLAAVENDVNKNKLKERKDIQLVDGRDINYYLGTAIKPYVYARGHIPGAKNVPGLLAIETDGPAAFIKPDVFLKVTKALDVNPFAPTITFCNSGHETTGYWFFVSEILGNKNIKLYAGSMQEWTLLGLPVTYMEME